MRPCPYFPRRLPAASEHQVDSLEYIEDEIRAAVQAANDGGTYLTTHAYTVAGIRRAFLCGLQSIEHAHLADEATVRLIGEMGAGVSTQPFKPGNEPLSPKNLGKTKAMVGAWERILGWAKTYDVHVAGGTDLLFNGTGTGSSTS